MPVRGNARPRRTPRRSRAANVERGEHSLTLAGATYQLRPSFNAIVAIEETLGFGLIELTRKANAFALSLPDLGEIVAELVRAGAPDGDDGQMLRAVSGERMAELIYEEGTGPAFSAVTLALTDAVMGGRTVSGEAKAATPIH